MLLQVEGVTKRFGGLVALSRVSLDVECGEVVGLIGPNGAGKTTLLNVIAGAYRPDAGTIRLMGESITGMAPEKICRKGVSRTFQVCHPFAKMTVLENVLVAAVFGGSKSTRRGRLVAQEMLDLVDFPLPGDTLTGTLNAGQLRRLDVARALASGPRVLLLDEVAAGLTPGELVELQDLIGRIRERGIGVLMVEHLMWLIMACCERIVVLHHGEMLVQGTPEVVSRDPRVIEAYLGESRY